MRNSYLKRNFYDWKIICLYFITAIIKYIQIELCKTGEVRLSLGEDDEDHYIGLDYVDENYYYDKDRLTRGRVEFCSNGSFYSVCRDNWSYPHAAAVCKQLGLSSYGILVQIF